MTKTCRRDKIIIIKDIERKRIKIIAPGQSCNLKSNAHVAAKLWYYVLILIAYAISVRSVTLVFILSNKTLLSRKYLNIHARSCSTGVISANEKRITSTVIVWSPIGNDLNYNKALEQPNFEENKKKHNCYCTDTYE